MVSFLKQLSYLEYRNHMIKNKFKQRKKKNAPGEDRTHDLKIMRLTRCRLRYRGYAGEEINDL
jgi:hypothetical protein